VGCASFSGGIGQGWAQRPAQLQSAVDAQEIVAGGTGLEIGKQPICVVAEDAGPLRPASLYRSPKLVSARSSKSGAITLSPSPGSSLRVATGRRKLSGFSRQHIICALCSSTPPTFFLAQTNPLPRLLSPSSSLIPLRSGVWIHPVSTPPPACLCP
jgi:hypothetical protein